MKAAKLYEPGNLKVENVNKPIIDEGEVLIKVKAIGICGSDIPRVLTKGAYYEGLIIGHEFSGEIVEVHSTVQDWKVGDRVTVAPLIPCNKCEYCKEGLYSLCDDYNYYGSRTDGAIADYIKVRHENLLMLPENITFEAGAMVDPAANAVHGLWRGNMKKGDVVAVFGLGAIGLLAVQFAREMGASKVIAIDIFDEKLKVAEEVGADIVVNSIKENIDGRLKDLNADMVLDTSGSPIAQNSAVLIANKRAKVVYLGISNDELTLSKESVNRLLRYEIELRGSWNSFSNPFPGREWHYSIELMNQNKINTDKLVSHRYTVEQTPEVFQKIKNKQLIFNKIIILPEE